MNSPANRGLESLHSGKSGFSRRQVSLLWLIAAAGLALRVVQIDRSFWFDEIATLVHVDAPDWLTVVKITAQDKQPPLYNTLAFAWTRVVGLNEVPVRLLSLLLGLLTVATPWVARESLERSEKVFICAFLCAASLPIRYAQEARNYSALLLFSSVCLFAYFEMLATRRPRIGPYLYVSLMLLAFSHLFGLLLAISFVGIFFLRAQGLARRIWLLLFGGAITAAVLVPLLLGGAAESAGGHFWIKFTGASLGILLMTLITPVGFALLAYALWIWFGGIKSVTFDSLWAQALAPFALMFVGACVISLHTPILTDRNAIGLIPAVALLIALLLRRRAVTKWGWVPVVLLSLMAIQSVVLIVGGFLFIREDFRATARQSIAFNLATCNPVPDGLTRREAADYQSIMQFYVTKIFSLPALAPQTFAMAELSSNPLTKQCRLWADPHPEAAVSVLRKLPQFANCADVPLAVPRARLTSVLVSCRPTG